MSIKNKITAELDAFLRREGYEPLGGISNCVCLHRGRGEVLKLAVSDEPVPRSYRLAGFQNCWEVSRLYAPEGLMPEVSEAGNDFAGTGRPYLKERYVSGKNLCAAYLDSQELWERRLPDEIVRLYQRMLASPSQDVTTFWDERLDWLNILEVSPHFPRYARVHGACRDAALFLRERCPIGYRLHGDLQLGNLLVRSNEPEQGRLILLDWELTGFYPLVFELAHFFQFLVDPVPQVEEPLKSDYARLRPLRRLWDALAPRLRPDLGITGEELKNSVLVHRIGWMNLLNRALEGGRELEAISWEKKLDRLVAGESFRLLPIPE